MLGTRCHLPFMPGAVVVSLALWSAVVCCRSAGGEGEDPPRIDPFSPTTIPRDDTIGGELRLSDGTIHAGDIFLPRDVRLKIRDLSKQQVREIPLSAVQRIECRIEREWQEKEWRFVENADQRKVYTGRSYPVRQYTHTITLHNGRSITGPLSAVVYVRNDGAQEPHKFLLHKRQKGELGQKLSDLVYVRSIVLGAAAGEQR